MGGVQRDAVAHDAEPIVPLLVERRQDNLSELLVKRLSILGRAVFRFLALRYAVNGPAGDAFDAALNPPAVEHAQAGHAVQRGFHSAGATGLHWRQRGVELHVHAGGEDAS